MAGTEQTWNTTFEGVPSTSGDPSDHPGEVQDFKLTVRKKLEHEHVGDVDTVDGGSAIPFTGIHRQGSAKVWVTDTEPTHRPGADSDGQVLLADDEGRMWISETLQRPKVLVEIPTVATLPADPWTGYSTNDKVLLTTDDVVYYFTGSGWTALASQPDIYDSKYIFRDLFEADHISDTAPSVINSLQDKIDALAAQLKAITGEAAWDTAPDITAATTASRLGQAVNTTSSPNFSSITASGNITVNGVGLIDKIDSDDYIISRGDFRLRNAATGTYGSYSSSGTVTLPEGFYVIYVSATNGTPGSALGSVETLVGSNYVSSVSASSAGTTSITNTSAAAVVLSTSGGSSGLARLNHTLSGVGSSVTYTYIKF